MTVFHGLPQSLQANTSIVPSNEATTASFRTLSNESITYHPFFRHLSHRKSVVKWTTKQTYKQTRITSESKTGHRTNPMNSVWRRLTISHNKTQRYTSVLGHHIRLSKDWKYNMKYYRFRCCFGSADLTTSSLNAILLHRYPTPLIKFWHCLHCYTVHSSGSFIVNNKRKDEKQRGCASSWLWVTDKKRNEIIQQELNISAMKSTNEE
jgi:hypothetical protein